LHRSGNETVAPDAAAHEPALGTNRLQMSGARRVMPHVSRSSSAMSCGLNSPAWQATMPNIQANRPSAPRVTAPADRSCVFFPNFAQSSIAPIMQSIRGIMIAAGYLAANA